MFAAVSDFVVLNDDEADDEGEDTCTVENSMYVGTLLFLLWGMRGLEEENSLDDEEEAGLGWSAQSFMWVSKSTNRVEELQYHALA